MTGKTSGISNTVFVWMFNCGLNIRLKTFFQIINIPKVFLNDWEMQFIKLIYLCNSVSFKNFGKFYKFFVKKFFLVLKFSQVEMCSKMPKDSFGCLCSFARWFDFLTGWSIFYNVNVFVKTSQNKISCFSLATH